MRSSVMTTLAIVISAAALTAMPSWAQNYPLKPLRLIAGNPGATADILARQIGRRLTERWGQQVIVDNRGGAGATIAAEIAANASPDGYTLLMGQLNSHAIAVNLHKKLSYDALKDFAPITLVASAPQVLVVTSSIPAQNWKEFSDYAKTHTDSVNYGSSGHGTASHLTTELLKQRTGLELAHVNYRGGAAAVRAIMGGEVNAGFVPLSTAWPMLPSGKIKILAISSVRRFPTLQSVPTLHESGLPGFEAASWFGMFAPARTPKTLVSKLNREIVEVLQTSSIHQDLLKLGAEATPSTPEEFRAFVTSEIVKWRSVIEVAGIKPQ